MEYILKNIPSYERANDQLNQATTKWQSEIENLSKEAQNMYKSYQVPMPKHYLKLKNKKREEDIVAKKTGIRTETRIFWSEGKPSNSERNRLSPFQDQIYEAVKQVAELRIFCYS